MKQTIKITAKKLPTGMQVSADMDGHTLLFDHAKDHGGDGQGPSPGVVMAAALGACQTMMIHTFAQKNNTQLRGFSIDVEADFDSDALKEGSNIRPGALEIRYRIHFNTDEPREKLENLLKLLESNCPVGDTIGNGTRLISQGFDVS
jgi:uncharacterized OsmC-like protein